ncbi:hypothetical protein EJ07DRAFT_176220 [Lizonia empirigonia]|nr:hypothetical protein EJ07DRAFT_176220 [Lizonia empirigonia]
MNSRVVHTLLEPTVVSILPVRTETYTLSSKISTAPTSLATITDTITVTATTTDSPVSLPTSTAIPPLPTEFDLPQLHDDYKQDTPVLAILTLVAVIISSIILLSAFCYFIFLRFRGKCPNCPDFEDQLKKWKRGELKSITPSMVQERMRAWDLEKGGMDLQVRMYKDRMQSLASLEGQSDARSERTLDSEQVKITEYFQVETKPQKPSPAHLPAHRDSGCHIDTSRPVSEDPEKTLVNNTGHPATWSIYQRDVIAPREAETKRSLQEAEEQAFTKLANVVRNPNNRESVLQRATAKLNDMVVAREERKDERQQDQDVTPVTHRFPPPRIDNSSRFTERFSLPPLGDVKK